MPEVLASGNTVGFNDKLSQHIVGFGKSDTANENVQIHQF
jgi:hypothetical protein